MENTDVKTAYDNAKADIANLLGWFECELSKEPDKLNWGHAGTLNKVKSDLLETLSFMSGFPEESIKESLEEARIDAQTQKKNQQPKG